MPKLSTLRGLRATDRTAEEQKAINQQMGYKQPASIPQINNNQRFPQVDTMSAAVINQGLKYKQQLNEQYNQALAESQQKYGVGRNSVNTFANNYIDKIASEVSSYYKKYNGTDKLPLGDQDKKKLAAEYDARKQQYGEDNANIWLDNQMKDIVGNNQSWLEQAWHGVSHLIPAIEGGLIGAIGNLYGAIRPFSATTQALQLLGVDDGFDENPDLGIVGNYLNNIIDNPITRYGRDVERAGASNVVQGFMNLIEGPLGVDFETAEERIQAMRDTATKYNPEGIGNDAIVTTSEQDESLVNSSTPWLALQSGGFTALSMMVGAGEAKAAQWLFKGAVEGANALYNTGRIIKTAEGLEKALVGLKKAQNATELFVIPGATGSIEGALEGLNTKIEVETQGVQELDEFYKNKVEEEAKALYEQQLASYDPNALIETKTDKGTVLQKVPEPSYADAYKQVWEKYKDEYVDSRRQIDWAASNAGIHNFFANSAINGAINQTFKAGLMAPRVQETLRNSRMFGWAYKNPKYMIEDDVVKPKLSKLDIAKQIIKEPFGESIEEYAQGLSNDMFAGAAENNISEFIENRFNPDATVKVTDWFGSDLAAALTALNKSLTSKESVENAILGAVSSTMGTVGGVGRGYHRNEEGKLVRNSMFDLRNFQRGLDEYGNKESGLDYIRRITPWRSGAMNAVFDIRKEHEDAKDTAAILTEWLKDPTNKEKWDGITGTAAWMTQMERAAESNDQFRYRKAQIGKAINDILTLQKLEGTSLHESIMTDLQRASEGQVSEDEIQKLRENGGEEYKNKSDQEIVEKIQSNANKMLGLMSSVEKESRDVERLLGRVDDDTKQSLVFGRLMEKDFKERRDQLIDEVNTIKGRIQNSVNGSSVSLTDEQTKVIMAHGGLAQALRDAETYQKEKEKLEKKIAELEAIDSKKMTTAQKFDLAQSRKNLAYMKQGLKELEALYEKDENGKRTDKIDSSLSQLVLNEEEIMNLDSRTRKIVLQRGAAKYYNATHQDRRKVDKLNFEIDELNHQIRTLEDQTAGWTTSDGKAKKRHGKQVERNKKKLAELQRQKESKVRELDAEQKRFDTKSSYSSAQQDVIDNLVRQGLEQDPDFLDKVIDIGRLDESLDEYHAQYRAILSDPEAYHRYVKRAELNAKRNLARRKAERVSRIEDFKEYSREVDKLNADASEWEAKEIFDVLREQDAKQKKQYIEANSAIDEKTGKTVAPTDIPKTNYDKYKENVKKQGDLVRQFPKNQNLTDNDMSLLVSAMQYLSSKGVDITDREAVVESLIEKDEQGIQGGMFRQWVEEKNSSMSPQQRITFTTIGQVVSDYVQLIDGKSTDDVNQGNIQPEMQAAAPDDVQGSPTVAPITSETPPPVPQQGGLMSIGYSSPDGGQINGDGTVVTDAQTQSMQKKLKEEKESQEPKSEIRQLFESVTTPEIAKMVDSSAGIISNSNESAEVKGIASQYLKDIAVNSDETYNTIDDLLDAVQNQVGALKEKSDMQEKPDDNDYIKAARLMNKVYDSLNAKKIKAKKGRRTAPLPSSRPISTNSAIIHTADLYQIEQNDPDAWPLRFTEDHQIDKWNQDHWPLERDEPIYFITDSSWSAETMASLSKYDTLTNMPLVIAVRVETPQDTNKTTAIEVNGLWYQPIGIMPSSNSKVSGAENTAEIRKLASKEQGIHLVTQDGLPNGAPLVARLKGVNYLREHKEEQSSQTRRSNSVENNSDVFNKILETLPLKSQERLRGLSKEELLNDDEYQEARSKFLNGLQWNGEGTGRYENQITFTPENHKLGEKGSPMLVFDKPMEETTARNSDKTLPEVLENGSFDDVVSFNSRIDKLYKQVIRPLFHYSPLDGNNARNALFVEDGNREELEAEAERLTKALNRFSGPEDTKSIKGINDVVFMNSKTGWSLKVNAPADLQVTGENAESVYKIYFVNEDPSIAPIEIGEIRVSATSDSSTDNIERSKEFLKNLLVEGLKINEGLTLSKFLIWQKPKWAAQNLLNPDKKAASDARAVWGDMVDDGLITFAGTSLDYEVEGVEIFAPIVRDAEGNTRIVYAQTTVANADNAQPAGAQNVTPQGDGAVTAKDGEQVDPDSGISLERNTPPPVPKQEKNAGLVNAEKTVKKIIADSKEFTLVEEEGTGKSYYVITDKATGQERRYLRVTTVIGADKALPELTEAEAKRRRINEYVWTPSIREIYEKLRESHSFQELTDVQLATFTTIDKMAGDLGITTQEIRRAVAELRTKHKMEKYGAWGTPSTSLGNTFDSITRDFLAGHLKDSYPNISKEAQNAFVNQLRIFKNDLDSKHIHIVSEGVMAHGTITMTKSDGTSEDVYVAGTLDLFGYDNAGNFYIFDMKTTRNHSTKKLDDEKSKWSRQISMYADLLNQQYGVNVSPENLRIIPINVDYPAPEEWNRATRKMVPVRDYREDKKTGQLQVSRHGKEEYSDFTMEKPKMEHEENGDNSMGMRKTTLDGQFQPGYTKLDITWDNLSSADQDIASVLEEQRNPESGSSAEPESATIETPEEETPSFMDTGNLPKGTIEAKQEAPRVIPNGTTTLWPEWSELSDEAKKYLTDDWSIPNGDAYTDMLNDAELAEEIYKEMHDCRGLI